MDNDKRRIGGGLSFFFFVLVVGLMLAAFNIGVGIGISLKIPGIEQNLLLGGAIGKKEIVRDTLPSYLRQNIADNSKFFNHTNALTIWLAEGIYIIVFGQEANAPAADLNFKILRN